MKRTAIVVGIFVSLAPGAAAGQVAGASALAEARREARREQVVASATKGPAFSDGRKTWRVVSDLRARPEADVAGFEVVDQRGPLAVVVATASPAGGQTVAVDVRSGRLGILTGTIVVKLADGAEAASIARAAGLTVRFVAEGIRYAYLVAPPGRDLVEAAGLLGRIPGVVEAHPEVLTNFSVGK